MYNPINRPRLIRELRTVAQKYFDKEPFPQSFGLCTAVSWLYDHPYADSSCSVVLASLGLTGSNTEHGIFLCYPGTCWGERAMFALILAEYLEQGGEV